MKEANVRFYSTTGALWAVLAAASVLGSAQDVAAQATPPGAPDSDAAQPAPAQGPPDAEAVDERPGSVMLIVFLAGDQKPAGIEISADTGESGTTADDGIVRLSVPAGKRTFSLKIPAGLLTEYDGIEPKIAQVGGVFIKAGGSAEVLLNLDAAGVVTADVEGVTVAEETAETEQEKPKAVEYGTISGKVVSDEDKAPIEGARIFVRGVDVEALSAADGSFSLKVPVGIHGVSSIHKKYSTQTQNDVAVTKDGVTNVTLEMTPASLQLDDVVVIAPYIEGGVAEKMAEKRETSAVAEVIGSEQMEASGDSSAAGALKRVTGLTLVGGKFIYVRGMGERYSSTLMNGLNLPSPEPERRVVPLDLFPAGILESVTVQKTYSPNMPGEFGGGSVQMRTKSFPDEFTLQVSGKLGLNTESTFKDGLTYRGGETDWFGLDDGTRDLPSELVSSGAIVKADRFNKEGLTAEEIEELGESFDPNYRIYRRPIAPDHGVEVTLGNTFDVGFPLGFMASLSYERKFRYVEQISRTVRINSETQELSVRNNYEVLEDRTEVNTGGMFVLGVEPLPHQRVESTTLLLRMTDDKTTHIQGFNDTQGVPARGAQLQWIERQLLAQQLIGHHPFTLDASDEDASDEPALDWRYGYSNATRAEPDRRRYRYDRSGGEFVASPDSLNHERFYSDLEDDMHEAGIDLGWPIFFSDERDEPEFKLTPKLGASVLLRNREVAGRRFQLAIPTTGGDARTSNGFRAAEPDLVYAAENIDDDGIELKETTLTDPPGLGSDTYEARQSLVAAYGMAETTLFQDVDVMAGARFEKLVQVTTSFDQFVAPADRTESDEVAARLDDFDILPAATITWRFVEDMQLRAGFGKTVSRPDFREKSKSRFFNVENDIALVGNPDLQSASILNFDARWEWYPSPDESFSIGGFYKQFERPIEVVGTAAAGTQWSWINSKGATNFGVELEGRKRLDFVGEAFEGFYVASNVSFIQSSVEIADDAEVNGISVVATSKERPLQGQSPYVINVQIGYDSAEEDEGISSALLYNVFGPRIDAVGSSNAPDIIEQPHHQLDFVFGYQLSKQFKLGFKAKNLLDGRRRKTASTDVDEQVLDSVRSGRDFSLSAKYSF